jgi:uncharacterized tellurite resistance protein B-like protein
MKNHSHDCTFISSLEQAGFDILYVFMLSDGNADESEFEVIRDYLRNDFIHKSSFFNENQTLFGECNFNKEFIYLQEMDRPTLQRRFNKAVSHINESLENHPDNVNFKQDILSFIDKMIIADSKISAEEQELLDILKKEWKI